jgi:hypothetical protein
MAYFENGLQLTPQGISLNTKILANEISFHVIAIAVGDGELASQLDPNKLSNELFRTDNIKIRILNPHPK